MLNPLIKNAYKVLDGEDLSYDEAINLAENINGSDIMDLISLANKVRKKYSPTIGACSLVNAKSGKCSQNCKFCAQSGFHDTGIETYPLLSKEEVLKAARNAWANGVKAFGYVTSGYGYLEANEEFLQILDTFDAVNKELPELKLCVSIGILSEKTAKMLSEHHVWRYNMNLQTNPKEYSNLISTTHLIEDKIATIKYLQKYKMSICCGGIIGLGETWKDRIEMALAVKDLDVEGIPLNVLLPIKGTAVGHLEVLSPFDVAKTFSLFRLLNPNKMIKFAAGRETTMKDFQALLMLSGINAIITGGYLTTRGRSVEDDKKFIDYLNLF